MPRIPQHAEKYAREDFSREVRRQQGYYDLMSQRALAEAAGIPRSTLREKAAGSGSAGGIGDPEAGEGDPSGSGDPAGVSWAWKG